MLEREDPYPERTTTMGDSDPVTTISPFQIISADETIMPKLRTCKKRTKLHHSISYLKSYLLWSISLLEFILSLLEKSDHIPTIHRDQLRK